MAVRVALLDANTVNQIAAGEVVERPAAVVKELVENAIDAQATRIETLVAEAGQKLIRVSDNGVGMSPEDARLALERHATSKIRSAGDLLRVTSLGFRGEALPSIASVSRLTLSTGEADGARRRIIVSYGDIEKCETIAGPQGTEVLVEGLFENTPARLKFMKSDATESSAITEVVLKYALAHPHIAFVLRFGEQVAISTSGNGDLLNVLGHVWGIDLARALAELDTTISGIRVQGFVGPPHVNKPSRSHQLLFVNGRPVRCKTLFAAIDAAFRSLTPERRHAVAVLSISIDPAEIDVNVSPTKTEIKFHREGAAFDAVRLAVKSALNEHGMMPSAATSFGSAVAAVLQKDESHAIEMAYSPKLSVLETEEAPFKSKPFPFRYLLEDLRVLGQCLNTFIVASTKAGIVIIDQHVAHERILYEHVSGIKSKGQIEIQALLTPEFITFERSKAIALRERLEDIEAVGFRLEPFGSGDFIIRAVPAVLSNKDYKQILQDIADELYQAGNQAYNIDVREKMWITSACRAAVKAGDVLSIVEMERLIAGLAETDNPYLCPHGRPIAIMLSYDELLRRFKRS